MASKHVGENKKVWFITGGSPGLSLVLVQKLLRAGYRVADTSRNAQALAAAIGFPADLFLTPPRRWYNQPGILPHPYACFRVKMPTTAPLIKLDTHRTENPERTNSLH